METPSPRECLLTLVVTPPKDARFHLSITNQGKSKIVISASEAKVKVSGLDQNTSPDSELCRCIRDEIEKQLRSFLDKHSSKIGYLRVQKKGMPVAPKGRETIAIPIDLSRFLHSPYFKIPNRFGVTITIQEATKEFTLELPPPKNDPKPKPLFHEDLNMILYDGPKPCYIDLTTHNTLKLRFKDSEADWVNLASQPPSLKAKVEVELVDNGQLEASVKESVKTAFNTEKITVIKQQGGCVIQFQPQRLNEALLTKDVEINLKVRFIHQEQPNKSLTGEVPVILQRPAFIGHAALDFGTTNSAVVYHNRQGEMANFPKRAFSPPQLRALQTTLEWLITTLKSDSLKQPKQRPLEDRMLELAQPLWAAEGLREVNTLDDIRGSLRDERRVAKANQLRVKLLVAWGNLAYSQFRRDHPELAKVLAKYYDQCLNQIIDIDIQEDAKMFLPALEPGKSGKGKDGRISSTVLMEELRTQPEKEKHPYPPIDAFKSVVQMGTLIEESMKDTAVGKLSIENLPHRNWRELHNLYVTGGKRWLGQSKEWAYFIGKQPPQKVFEDNYDAICTATIKHLLAQTEKHIGASSHLQELVVTYPANFSQSRRQRLKEMVASLGIQKKVDMGFDEATAGALYYVWRELFTDLFAGIDGFLARSHLRQEGDRTIYYQNLLLYDMGGGTTDIALLEIGVEELRNLPKCPPAAKRGRYFVIRPKLLGLTGNDNFAGDNVTLAVFRILKCKLAIRVADLLLQRFYEEKKDDKGFQVSMEIKEELKKYHEWKEKQTQEPAENDDTLSPLELWLRQAGAGRSYHHDEFRWRRLIDLLVPTDFHNDPKRQSAFFELWKEAQDIKEHLSRLPKKDQMRRRLANDDRLLPALKLSGLNFSVEDQNTLVRGLEVLESEMERVVEQDIENTFIQARELCVGQRDKLEKVGDQEKLSSELFVKHYIDRVILAGSSSQLRLVREVKPKEILGQEFVPSMGESGRSKLPAPFKYDDYNLVFEPNEAKLAVVRGACLAYQFGEHGKVAPDDPEIHKLLRDEDNTLLDFKIDNLRNHVPFTLVYPRDPSVGKLFEAGEPLPFERQGKKVARNFVPRVGTLTCYRVENLSQKDGPFYDEFDIEAKINQLAQDRFNWDKSTDPEKIEAFAKACRYYVEFDVERNLQCWVYTNPDGNSDDRVINQTASLLLGKHKAAEVVEVLCEQTGEEWVWKSDLPERLTCDLNDLSGKGGKVEFENFSPTTAKLTGKVVGMRKTFSFRAPAPTASQATQLLLWEVSLPPDYKVKSREIAELRFTLERLPIDHKVVLKYSLYDPDFESEKDNHEVPPRPTEPRGTERVNPFSGRE